MQTSIALIISIVNLILLVYILVKLMPRKMQKKFENECYNKIRPLVTDLNAVTERNVNIIEDRIYDAKKVLKEIEISLRKIEIIKLSKETDDNSHKNTQHDNYKIQYKGDNIESNLNDTDENAYKSSLSMQSADNYSKSEKKSEKKTDIPENDINDFVDENMESDFNKKQAVELLKNTNKTNADIAKETGLSQVEINLLRAVAKKNKVND